MKDYNIKDTLNGKKPLDDGMTVPDGYFADFARRLEARIPERVAAPEPAPQSFWQKVRPFVYMAAMFAGIWCMMHMFDLMRPSASAPAQSTLLSEALSDENFINDYYINDEYDDIVLDDLYDDGYSPVSFKY